MRLLYERTDTSGRCLNKPLCSYMARTWLTVTDCLVRMPQVVWTVTQLLKYMQQVQRHACSPLALPVALHVVT